MKETITCEAIINANYDLVLSALSKAADKYEMDDADIFNVQEREDSVSVRIEIERGGSPETKEVKEMLRDAWSKELLLLKKVCEK